MVGPGINLATTKDGEAYNKLQRPSQTYLASTAPPLPPTRSLPADISPSASTKRKRDHAHTASSRKRVRDGEDQDWTDNPLDSGASTDGTRGADSGMRVLLPSFADDEHSSDDSTAEALAYLRSVQSEASGIPHLLVGTGPRQNIRDTGDDRGIVFREGTWIAVEQDNTSATDDQILQGNIDALLPQDRYYQLLLRRFDCVRTSLQAAAKSKDTTTTAAADFFLPRNERSWTNTIHREAPKPAQVLLLDEAAIYSGLQCCARSLEGATSISTAHSCWIWSLLAVVGDAGTMSHEKIGRIREIGQEAGSMGARLRADSYRTQYVDKDFNERQRDVAHADTGSEAEMSISGDEETLQMSAESSDLERARACLLTQLGDRLVNAQVPLSKRLSTSRHTKAVDLGTEVDQAFEGVSAKRVSTLPDLVPAQREGRKHLEENEETRETNNNSHCLADVAAGEDGIDLNTRVTIDMVLTVVAEYFGQRDLLAYRHSW